MYQAGLLSAQEYATAKLNAARELVSIPQEVTSGLVFGDGGANIYNQLAADQQAKDRKQLEDAEAHEYNSAKLRP